MEDQIRELARQEAEKVFAEKMAAISTQPEHISLKEFSKTYGISMPTLYRHIDAGHLHLVKFGGKSFIKRSEADKLFVEVK